MYSSAYVWAKVLSHMEERLGAVTVSAWFDDAEVVELTEDHLILYSSSDFRREIIRRRCTEYIQDALKEIFSSDAKLIVFGDEELQTYQSRGKTISSMDFNPQFTFDSFIVKAVSKEATTKAITMLDSFLSTLIDSNNGYYSVYSQNEWMESDQSYTDMLSLVVGGIAGISLLVGGIGIMNIMLVTVTERTREIGIRMAIGASRASIILQFLIEAAVICAVGGILGLVVSVLGTLVAGKLIMDMVLTPGVGMTIGAVGFSVVLGIVFGLYPAIKASSMQPVEALRAD